VKSRKNAIEAAKKVVLEKESRVQTKTGAELNALKLQIYDELRSQGLDYEADLLMVFDAAMRASMGNQPSITYNFHDNQIANANFGTQIGNITASLTAIGGKDDQRSKDFSTALKQLTEAIVNSPELNDQQKKEALEALSFVGKQGEEQPEKRQTGILRAMLEGIPKILSAGASVVKLWHTVGPHISAFFGF
jgi:hypothetical protein